MTSITFKNLDHITDTCAICLAEVTDEAAHKVGEAFHRFHAVCLGTWLIKQPTCPTCKGRVTHINGKPLEHPGIDRAQRIVDLLADEQAGRKIISAAQENNIERVRELLTHRYISLGHIVSAALEAAYKGHIDVVRELLDSSLNGFEHLEHLAAGMAVFEAAKSESSEIVHLLLNDPRKNGEYKSTVEMSCSILRRRARVRRHCQRNARWPQHRGYRPR